MERLARGWTRASATSALLLVAVATGTGPVQAGKRIAPVGTVCPAEAPQKQIDADGVKDVCVARAPVSCAADQRLVKDASGNNDRCVAPGAAAATAGGKPSCPPGLDLKVRPGEDSCERTAKPVCPSGSHLTPRAKEDFCEY